MTFNSGTATQSITGSTSTTFQNLTVSTSGSGLVQLATGTTVSGTLSITSASGILDLAGNNLTASGTFANNGTLKLKGSEATVSLPGGTIPGTVLYYGNGAGTITGLKAGNSYTNLSFVSAGGAVVYQLATTLSVGGHAFHQLPGHPGPGRVQPDWWTHHLCKQRDAEAEGHRATLARRRLRCWARRSTMATGRGPSRG